ncbi:MAG: rod shape-determining protein MreD [Acidobacteriota bacterium]
MSFVLAALVLIGAVVLQSVVSGIWPATSRFFDLPLIAVLYYAIVRGPGGALMAGTGAGLLQDALGGTLLGVSALSKAVAGYLMGILALRLALFSLISRILVVAAATVTSRFVELATMAIMGRRLGHVSYSQLFESVPGNCLLGALILSTLKQKGPD